MTIASSINRSPLYTTPGTGPYTFNFKVFAPADIEVYRRMDDGTEFVVPGNHYTVSLNPDQNSAPGGHITLSSNYPLLPGQKLLIMRTLQATQEVDIQNAGGFYPEVIESALDKLTMLVQNAQEELNRALKLEPTSTENPKTVLDNLLAGGGGGGGGGGGASHLVNVLDYGAVGDNVVDDTAAIQTALDYAAYLAKISHNRNVVTVLVPTGHYKITSQIIVPSGANLHTEGILYNNLSSVVTPVLLFKAGSHTSKLQLFGNYNSGVLFGEYNTYCNMQIGDVRLWNIGESINQFGIRFTGYNFTFESLEVDGGNIGVDIETASDIRGDKIIVFTASTGLRITSGSEHIQIGSIMIDSPEYRGIQIDSSHDINLSNVAVFLNDNEVSSGLDASGEGAAYIGQYSSDNKVNNLVMNLRVQNTGGTALRLFNLRNSLINLVATNALLGTGNSYPITTAVEYGAGVESSVNLVISADSGMTLYTGTPVGNLIAPNNTHILSGVVGIGTAPTVGGTGKLHISGNTLRLDSSRTISSATAAGNQGEICWDGSYIYVCVANNTWRRVAINAW